MTKYLFSTLVAAAAMAVPAWAGLGYGDGGGITADKGTAQSFTGDVTFASGSSLIVKNGTPYTLTSYGNAIFNGSATVSVTEASSLTLAGGATFNDEDGVGPMVVIAEGSSLVTSDAVTFNGGTISIDETSTWTSGDNNVVTFGANAELAITTTADSEDASVQLDQVYFYAGASVSITVDLSDINVDEGVSIVLFEATSIIFDYDGETGTGTTLTEANINTFMEDYVTFTGGVVAEEWSYDAATGRISATITYLPEPSMFGLMFGLGAIGLVATRRRRRA